MANDGLHKHLSIIDEHIRVGDRVVRVSRFQDGNKAIGTVIDRSEFEAQVSFFLQGQVVVRWVKLHEIRLCREV